MSRGNTTIRKGRERFRVAISFDPLENRTKQSFKDECDINKIMSKWRRTGVLEHMAAAPPVYGDFDNYMEYQDAQNRLISADAAFAALPSHIRKRMDNDPAKFLEFMADPENLEEAQELGLARKPSDPAKTVPTDPSPEGGTASEAPASPSTAG